MYRAFVAQSFVGIVESRPSRKTKDFFRYSYVLELSHDTDEWEPSCDEDANASNNVAVGADDFMDMQLPGAYRQNVLNRAGTIIHEATHGDVGHIDDDQCDADASCDHRYGQYDSGSTFAGGSQTMNINFLYDAASMYQTSIVGGKLVRIPAISVEGGDRVTITPLGMTFPSMGMI